MFRFTIRDVLWLMVVVALAVCLWANQSRSRQQIATMSELVDQLKKESKVWESRAESLRNDVLTGSNKNTDVEFIPNGMRYVPKDTQAATSSAPAPTALLRQPANANEPEKVMVGLQRVVVGASRDQPKSAVFAILHYDGGMGLPRIREEDTNQIIVGLNGPSTTDVAARNVLAIIGLFPVELDEQASGFPRDRVSKPKGRLIFLVPRQRPEERLAEWEISRLTQFTMGHPVYGDSR